MCMFMCMCLCMCMCMLHVPCTHHAHTMQEQLEALAEAYADPAAEKVESDDEGDAEID